MLSMDWSQLQHSWSISGKGEMILERNKVLLVIPGKAVSSCLVKTLNVQLGHRESKVNIVDGGSCVVC